jgi:8-amino-7-oxononanoate synthase
LIGPGDLVLVDELVHGCIMAGARLSGARTLPFRHNDLGHLEELVARHRAQHRHALIATDGVFSMDGDLAPLPQLAAIARSTDCWLLSDDAHGIGVVGGGRGSSFATGGKADVELQMGTLSKAIGGYGGYLCASRPVIDLIKTRARTLIYSTGLPPASVAAAIAALNVIESDPAYAALPVAKARLFTRRLGLEDAVSPIVPVVIGDARAALEASQALERQGFLVVAIRPPTVPAGTARLRIAFTAGHPDSGVERLADAVRPFVRIPA